MKKLLTLLAFAIPSLCYSQAYSTNTSSGSGGFVGAILFLGLAILILLALRSIMLWYWKVDTMLKNQETTNKLLKNNNDLLNEYIVYMKDQNKKN